MGDIYLAQAGLAWQVEGDPIIIEVSPGIKVQGPEIAFFGREAGSQGIELVGIIL